MVLCGGFSAEVRAKKMRQDGCTEFISASLRSQRTVIGRGFTMKVYCADAVERFVEDMLKANEDNLKAYETKPGVYANVDPDTHHDTVEIPDVHLTK